MLAHAHERMQIRTQTHMLGVSCEHMLTTTCTRLSAQLHLTHMLIYNHWPQIQTEEQVSHICTHTDTHTQRAQNVCLTSEWHFKILSLILQLQLHTHCVALCICVSATVGVCACSVLRSPQGALRCHFLFVDMHVVVAMLWARSTVLCPLCRMCVCMCVCVPMCLSLHADPLSRLWVTGAGLVMELNSLCR